MFDTSSASSIGYMILSDYVRFKFMGIVARPLKSESKTPAAKEIALVSHACVSRDTIFVNVQ